MLSYRLPVLSLTALLAVSAGAFAANAQSADASADAPTVTPGSWKTTLEIKSVNIDENQIPEEMRGMMTAMNAALVGQTTEVQQCITPEQASEPEAQFFAANQEADCDISEYTVEGGKMNLAMTCANPRGEAAMTATGQYNARDYAMDMVIKSESQELGTMTINMAAVGEYLGECEGGEAVAE